MQDVSKILRDAYFAALSGLTYNSQGVELYEIPPQNAETPYVLIGEQSDTEESQKSCDGHNATLLFDIVSDYDGTYGTRDDVDQISNSILSASPSLSFGKIVVQTMDNVSYLTEILEGKTRIRKLLRMRYIIQE